MVSSVMDIQQQIEKKLRDAFDPLHLEVIDESHMHRVPKGAKTHFKAVVVSDLFEGLTRLERHKKVYRVLLVELDGLIKAFSLYTHTSIEWRNRQGLLAPSPPCMGGGDHRPQTSSLPE